MPGAFTSPTTRSLARRLAASLGIAGDELERIRDFFGEGAEIIAEFKTPAAPAAGAGAGNAEADILAVAGRRPVTVADLALSLGRPDAEIAALISRLAAAGKVKAVPHNDAIYYETP